MRRPRRRSAPHDPAEADEPNHASYPSPPPAPPPLASFRKSGCHSSETNDAPLGMWSIVLIPNVKATPGFDALGSEAYTANVNGASPVPAILIRHWSCRSDDV